MDLTNLSHSWPEKSGEYKVIQIVTPHGLFLRFGKRTEPYGDFHKEIVRRFAGEIGVSCELGPDRGGCGVEVNYIPEVHDEIIVGMGRCYFNIERGIAAFSGGSEHYWINLDLDHLKGMRNFSSNEIFVVADDLLYLRETTKSSD